MQKDTRIDAGKPFDWGLASGDYAKYRDIYPPEFYDLLLKRGLCTKGQRVLDLGTGTGVLPRALYGHGASFIGTDISEGQIAQARRLSARAGMDIEYIVSPAEEITLPENSLDAATACQCFFYFKPRVLLPRLKKSMKPGAVLAILFMAWLPGESEIAVRSEALVLCYSPAWSGTAYTRTQPTEPEWVREQGFPLLETESFTVEVPFTRESWNGRMRACRGVGASLPPEQVLAFEKEHRAMLAEYPESFTIPHHVTAQFFENKK